MSSSNSPPASSGTLHLTSSPTTSHNSIESININAKEQHLPPLTKDSPHPTSTSPPTNPSSITDFASQQLPSLSTTHPFSAPTPPSPSLSAAPTKPPLDRRATELAAREAKAHIRSILREDWEWPPQSPSPQPECHALSWREREHSDEDNDTLPSSTSTTDDESIATDANSTTTTPSRKRKRRATLLLQEEVSQNGGLRLWHARRNHWSGARHPPSSPSALSTPASPIQIPIPPPLLPPTNPIRSSITESTYPAIYSKVVVQGLSPTVPINLADMVRACVMGWKKDGEWPPKGAEEAERAAAAAQAHRGRGRRLARRGVGRVKRVLGLGVGHAGGVEGGGGEGGG
ncbi:MAG: hypothetical protein OHK93_004584 [Ramalina farinacea]|uniref:Gag1-like clamp domain-containing protein n=1 Tax=Ramalina farinacea TaxID=258253 RepID=A0AA43QUC5_9LECA|nr:hypothetical protein [Ramalina farinacea]